MRTKGKDWVKSGKKLPSDRPKYAVFLLARRQALLDSAKEVANKVSETVQTAFENLVPSDKPQ